MGFQKGHKKVGGKQKGTKNKQTEIWNAFGEELLSLHVEGVNEVLKAWKDSKEEADKQKYLNAVLQLFEYFKPKLSRAENKHEITSPVPTFIPQLDEKQIKEIRNKLSND